jgi:predicted nucleic-acid-binding protein
LETLIATPTFTLPDSPVIFKAIQQYRKTGDFADLLIVDQAKKNRAKYLFSFDKKLQKIFPDFVISNISDFVP